MEFELVLEFDPVAVTDPVMHDDRLLFGFNQREIREDLVERLGVAKAFGVPGSPVNAIPCGPISEVEDGLGSLRPARVVDRVSPLREFRVLLGPCSR